MSDQPTESTGSSAPPGATAPSSLPPGDQRPPIGYEQARDELMQIVQQLESGSAPLEEALSLWERGEELALICQQWLDGARARIEAARPTTADRDST